MQSQWNSVPGRRNCMCSGPGGDLVYVSNEWGKGSMCLKQNGHRDNGMR